MARQAEGGGDTPRLGLARLDRRRKGSPELPIGHRSEQAGEPCLSVVGLWAILNETKFFVIQFPGTKEA